MLLILQDINTGQKESFPCEHGTLVVMSQLASGAAEQKYQHAITNSSGNLILVIEGYLNPGKSLKETFELIMNEFTSTKRRRDVVGVCEPFLLEDPAKATIASAHVTNAASCSARAIAAKEEVNWSDNQKGLQSAIIYMWWSRQFEDKNRSKETSAICYISTQKWTSYQNQS